MNKEKRNSRASRRAHNPCSVPHSILARQPVCVCRLYYVQITEKYTCVQCAYIQDGTGRGCVRVKRPCLTGRVRRAAGGGGIKIKTDRYMHTYVHVHPSIPQHAGLLFRCDLGDCSVFCIYVYVHVQYMCNFLVATYARHRLVMYMAIDR